ncbi:hypothetical protein WJX84_011626 [Apatococcus fuscideae]
MAGVLRTCKEALEEALISSSDFDVVKTAFLRAQSIKAGLDAGFILPEDYAQVKHVFLSSLHGISSNDLHAAIQAFGQQSHAQLDSAPGKEPSQYQSHPASQQQPPSTPARPASAAEASTPQRQSHAQSSASTPAAPPPPPPSPGSALGQPRTSQTEIPTNIPKMGGRRLPQAQGTSMSGISVGDDAINLYYFMKAKSTYRWATWRINDAGNEVVISNVGDKDSNYRDFVGVLPPNDCRYGVYDFQYTNSDNCIFNKLVFLSWAPDRAKIKSKMMYASTKDFFKGFLDGLSIELQASEPDDVTEENIEESVRSVLTRQ